MTGVELLELVRSADRQIATLYAQLISMNFAMIVAIYYFLNRSRLLFKAFAFLFYAVGMLAFWGMSLREANIKALALRSMSELSRDSEPLPVVGLHDLSHQWLVVSTSVLMNLGFWLMWASVVYLLFFWSPVQRAASVEARPANDAD